MQDLFGGKNMKKCILSVVGKDKVGITAGVCGVLADAGVNILDITQTILQEYFTMVVLVDIDTSNLDFGQIAEKLEEYGKESGMEIHIQREEIFDAMHRI